ncbi:receptor kinase-like protein Xa21 [Nicotiana sylvestris]
MARLRRLKVLDLRFNNFSGKLPVWFGLLHQLRILNLENNSFIGSIPSTISNISTLKALDLTFNSIEGNIPEGIGNLHNLNFLAIEYNQLTGSIPYSVFNISKIDVIAFTDNSLSGRLPNGLCNRLPILIGLDLSQNKFHGHMPTSLSNCSELRALYLSGNEFDGPIHSGIGSLSKLQELDIGDNHFTGIIPHGSLPWEIGNLTKMQLLYLNNNRFIGEIPKEIRNFVNLEEFDIGFNRFSGSLAMEIFNSSRMRAQHEKPSAFQVGDYLCKLKHLDAIYLGQNQLSGSLPNCLGNVTSLREMQLGSNKLSSNIPASLWSLKDLVVLDLSSNNMGGSLPPEIGKLKAATHMNLSMNQFSSGIPIEIGGLQNLVYLSLRHNKLQGSIPGSMRNMVGLEFLDLSHNNISGTIPKSLEKLQYLNYFNVSYNKLYGEIPSGGPFKNLSSQVFLFNEALCGSTRFSVPPCPTSSKHRSNRNRMLVLFLLLGIVLVFVPITFVLVWIRYKRGKRAHQQADSLSLATRERISYYELLQATNALSESNLIGSGSFGSVYRGILKSGTPIAVKVFNLQLEVAFMSFDTECEVLRNLRHRNLTKVITSCSNLDFKALVLEYMPNGSLDKWLYSHNYFLDIMQRLNIMMDVACALEYLHHECLSPVIHCDMKPSNILLDENMVAHLSDFGISKLLGEDESDLYTKTLATFGYITPEYGRDGLVSTKCDVYSYGIMLMETFTRRNSNDEMFDGDLSLKKWVSYSLPETIMDVVDANLVTPRDNHLNKKLYCVASIMKVALDCCVDSHARRIDMKDIVGMLHKIKIQLLAC